MNEPEVLNRIRENPAAFSELFKLYYPPVFGYILRRTGDFNHSADIAANTFLKAFTHIQGFSYRGISIKIWLYRIATNEVAQYFRHQQKHNAIFSRLEPEDEEMFRSCLQEDREAMEAELQKHQQFLTILAALKTLHVKYQEVLSLRYFEGKDNREIAAILDLKEGTLKSLFSRGLEKLREKCNQI